MSAINFQGCTAGSAGHILPTQPYLTSTSHPTSGMGQTIFGAAIPGNWKVSSRIDTRLFMARATEELSLEKALPLAQEPLTPPALLEELSRHKEREVRRAVAQNPNTPGPVLVNLAPDCLEEVLMNPALYLLPLENPNFSLGKKDDSQETIQTLVKKLKWLAKQNINVPENSIKLMARHPAVEVRQAVAKGKLASVEVLKLLADDQHWHVRSAVARNPLTPRDVIARLAIDEITAVRGVALNELLKRKI